MAAPIEKDAAPLGKLVFEKSNLKHPKSKHKECIDEHHFNYAISCIFPNCNRVPESIHYACMGQKAFFVHNLPVQELISIDVIEAFIKKGKLRLLSHNTCIDKDDCVSVLPTGHLILHLSKDTYQQLGIEGTPSRFPKRSKLKYVVDIDLCKPSFRPDKKGYKRVKWCLQDRLNLRFDFLVSWTPTDNEISPSSIRKYFSMKGFKCTPMKMKCNMKKYTDILVPDIDPCKVDFDQMEYSYNDVYEWLGGLSNGINLSCDPDGYLSTYSFSGPTKSPMTCSCVQYKGFFSSETIQLVLEIIRQKITDLKMPWCSITVHGFSDSPFSWKQREHGYFNCGDNSYTYVIFPDDDYWLYSAYGSYDLVS